MKLVLSRTEIIKRRRIAGGFDYTSTAATVESTTGIDLDAHLGRDTRRRYLELLDTAPRRLLAPSDIAAECSLAKGTDGGSEIRTPASCRRVFEMRLAGWHRACEVAPCGQADAIAHAQANPYAAATARRPVAVELPGRTDGGAPTIAAWPAGTAISSVTAASDPGPETYIIDEAALGLLLGDTTQPTT